MLQTVRSCGAALFEPIEETLKGLATSCELDSLSYEFRLKRVPSPGSVWHCHLSFLGHDPQLQELLPLSSYYHSCASAAGHGQCRYALGFRLCNRPLSVGRGHWYTMYVPGAYGFTALLLRRVKRATYSLTTALFGQVKT